MAPHWPDELLPSWESIEGAADENYEDRVCDRILSRTGSYAARQQLVRQANDRNASPLLSLQMLYEEWGLPLRLVAARMTVAADFTERLWKRPTTTKVYRAFDDSGEVAADQPLSHGLVFPWAGHGRFMVFHDFMLPERSSIRISLTIANRHYTVESLDAVIDTVGPPVDW